MLESNKDKKIKQLIADLQSLETTKVLQAIIAFQSEGNSTILEPLCIVLLHTKEEKVSNAILTLLNDLKDTSSAEIMMRLVQEDRFVAIRQQLLSTIWNSPIDYTYYLPEFVGLAVEGSFMEALECLTIIENLEGPFEERHVLESQLHLKEYAEDKAPKDDQKAKIISEIALFIKDLDQLDLDDDISLYND